jgi:hypothetical protein
MTLAIRSRPWEIWRPSTEVGIEAKVLRTEFEGTPGAKSVLRLGSKVSVWAMPPAIQRRMTESALAGSNLAAALSRKFLRVIMLFTE